MFNLYTSKIWNKKGKYFPLNISSVRKAIYIAYYRIIYIGIIDISTFSDYAHIGKLDPSKLLSYDEIIEVMKHEKLRVLFAKNIRIKKIPSKKKLSFRITNLYYHQVGKSYLNEKSYNKKSKDLIRLSKKINDINYSSIKLEDIDNTSWNKILDILRRNKINIGVSKRKVNRLLSFLRLLRDHKPINNVNFYIDVMNVGKNIAAIHIGIKYGSYYLYWLPAYSDIYKKYSPGLQLLSFIINGATERQISHIDFGNGNESYKKWFATGECTSFTGLLWS